MDTGDPALLLDTADDPAAAEVRETTGEPINDASDEAALVGAVLGERYQIVRRLGRGGMGEVYLARHVRIDKPVAVKVVRPGRRGDPEALRRFLREARASSRIRHENVVDITDFGEREDGLAYFVMELLEGEDLAALCEREGPLAWRRARALALQIVRALAAAHAQGIIHRDMKPANCFVVRRADGSEQIKVLDFGIAKVASGDADDPHETTGVLGTAAYMAPEQAIGRELDARADLYAVGVLLYKMLTGQLPFSGASSMAVISKHLHVDAPDLRASGEVIPAALRRLVAQLLAKDPDERPASAAEVAARLEGLEGAGGGRRLLLGALGLVGAVAIGIVVAAREEGGEPARRRAHAAERAAPPVALPPEAAATTTQAGAEDMSTETGMEAAATTATTGEVEEAATTASRPRPVTPAILERTLVRRLGARVKGCADEAGAWIRAVPVRVEVAANGRVVSAAFHEELSPRFRGCLERLIVGRTLPAPGQRTSLSLTLRW